MSGRDRSGINGISTEERWYGVAVGQARPLKSRSRASQVRGNGESSGRRWRYLGSGENDGIEQADRYVVCWV